MNQATHSFTFIFCLPGHSPKGDLRYLLALAGWYKPPTQSRLAGRDQIPQKLSPPFSLMRLLQVLDPLRVYSPRTVELTFTSFNNQSCIHNYSEVVTIPPFSQVPWSYLMPPSWEQGGDQSPFLPVGVGSDWGLAPGPYLILWPFLVSWSALPLSPVRAQPFRVRTPVRKRTWNTVRWHTSSFIQGLLRSNPDEPPVQWLKGLAWLEPH